MTAAVNLFGGAGKSTTAAGLKIRFGFDPRGEAPSGYHSIMKTVTKREQTRRKLEATYGPAPCLVPWGGLSKAVGRGVNLACELGYRAERVGPYVGESKPRGAIKGNTPEVTKRLAVLKTSYPDGAVYLKDLSALADKFGVSVTRVRHYVSMAKLVIGS